jgi:hypothetical protein
MSGPLRRQQLLRSGTGPMRLMDEPAAQEEHKLRDELGHRRPATRMSGRSHSSKLRAAPVRRHPQAHPRRVRSQTTPCPQGDVSKDCGKAHGWASVGRLNIRRRTARTPKYAVQHASMIASAYGGYTRIRFLHPRSSYGSTQATAEGLQRSPASESRTHRHAKQLAINAHSSLAGNHALAYRCSLNA